VFFPWHEFFPSDPDDATLLLALAPFLGVDEVSAFGVGVSAAPVVGVVVFVVDLELSEEDTAGGAAAAPAAPCCTTTQLPKPLVVVKEAKQRSLDLPPEHFVPAGRAATIF
jgi:hypothetical protein